MKQSIGCITPRGNIYTINKDKKLLYLTHPKLAAAFYGNDELQDADDYYIRKAKYFEEYGLLDGIEHQYDGVITPSMVRNSLANLNQLVFEVTDACNLQCKYCGYRELYDDYDQRTARMMGFEEAKRIIDYLIDIWNSSVQEFTNREIYFGFYGGEPLLNMKLIKEIVSYVESCHIPHRSVCFSMTTNAMLLNQHMDYLAEKEVRLLISLDGNEWNNSYRLTVDGKNSFKRNIANVDALKEKYPEYFEKYVSFNAVLHNRNSVDEIFTFIKERYGKAPRISPLNDVGIREDKKEEFEKMYKNATESFYQSKNYELILDEMFMNTGEYNMLGTFLMQYNQNVFRTYNNLFTTISPRNFIPTGTCKPFSRKMFVTVNGKILPCERIGQQYGMGCVESCLLVNLSFEEIAEYYNRCLDKLRSQCQTCYRTQSCSQCMFSIDRFDSQEQVKCPEYTDAKTFAGYVSQNISFIEEHPNAYERVMDVVIA